MNEFLSELLMTVITAAVPVLSRALRISVMA